MCDRIPEGKLHKIVKAFVPQDFAKTQGLAASLPCPSGGVAAKIKDAAKHVEPKAECLRTRVRFPPPHLPTWVAKPKVHAEAQITS